MRGLFAVSQVTTIGALFLAVSAPALAETAFLAPVKDNTLYGDPTGVLSNGGGDHFFAGQNGRGWIVRGLMEFDIAGSIPAGSTITAATLTVYMSRTNNPVVETVSLHRALAEWGEGASQAFNGEGSGTAAEPTDATWLHTFFDTSLWSTPGGDFSPTPSASTGVGDLGFYSWSSAELAADVADFLANPDANHGWIVIGNEAAFAKRFDSRTNQVGARRPELVIEFEPAAPVPALGDAGVVVLGALLVGASLAVPRHRRAA